MQGTRGINITNYYDEFHNKARAGEGRGQKGPLNEYP